jgi:hypothetical protein
VLFLVYDLGLLIKAAPGFRFYGMGCCYCAGKTGVPVFPAGGRADQREGSLWANRRAKASESEER